MSRQRPHAPRRIPSHPRSRPPAHQILFLSGVVTTIGPRAAAKFFTKRRNYKGSGAFLGGFALVLLRWPITGICAQAYGAVLLFADFVPTALPFARRVPVLGHLLSLPPVRTVRPRAVVRARARMRQRKCKREVLADRAALVCFVCVVTWQGLNKLVGLAKRGEGLPV
jgi:hypothetical protein